MKKSLNSKKVIQIGILTTSAAALITGVTLASTLDNSSTKQMNSQKIARLNNKSVSNKIKNKNLEKVNQYNNIKTTTYSMIDANTKLNNVTLTTKQTEEVKKYAMKFLEYRKGHNNIPLLESIKGFLKQFKDISPSKYNEINNILNKQIVNQSIKVGSTHENSLKVNPYRSRTYSKGEVKKFLDLAGEAAAEAGILSASAATAAAGYYALATLSFGLSVPFAIAATTAAGTLAAQSAILTDAKNKVENDYKSAHNNKVVVSYKSIGAIENTTQATRIIIKTAEVTAFAVPWALATNEIFNSILDLKIVRELG
ncbi:MAG: hypothetical protein HRT98_01195 [Mycoplasmatales bacterium]|nr:hypothetical protein [Mycoplasmatales bacterium]